jgi:hypothetical protein
MLTKLVNGVEVVLSPEEEKALKQEWVQNDTKQQQFLYKTQRENEYPLISDQLDLIYKIFTNLKNNNVDLGPEGIAWINQITTIKNRYPKPC